MYAVSPKFLNVDIKIYVNVLEGEVDIYISKSEDFFLVEWNSETQQHEVKVDPLYTLDDGRQKRDLRYRRATSNNTSNMLHLVESKVNSDMFSTYIQAETSHTELDSVYYIRGIRNRLILTLPEKGHELKTDKFYIVVVGTGSPHSRGRIIFRQDQIRIDLFVFFAVFFSCFFKFLSVCVIVWKIRSLYRQQQRRLQRAVELGQMASRPFASLLIHFDEPDLEPANQNRPSEFQVNPAACEFTDDGVAAVSTVIFEMPGGRDVPARAMFGSTLITHRVMFPNRKLPPERQKVTPT
ncbi:MEGF8 [Bugula neritina]|uniref:MEGF8 n=1 Tax=Bugula neritina TaxID=10212 RepID=A0A7J7K8N2_BUGNE|nr:MEGF8 [Bugula neritina]